jgi:diaminopimelate epimerase
MRFQKWHGLGNDYLFLDARISAPPDPAALARVLSDRRRGPGGDGLILLESPIRADADVRMSIRNADGSDGGMCGNGLRCLAAWVVADELVVATARHDRTVDRLRIEVGSGCASVTVDGREADRGRWSVAVALPGPRFELESIPAGAFTGVPGGRVIDLPVPELATIARAAISEDVASDVTWSLVSTGNPHLVARVPEGVDLDAIDLATLGSRLEHDPHFPDRINVHVVADPADGPVRMRTWERGSGLTQACGTGACATVAALVAAGRRRPGDAVRVELPGGTLEIAWFGATDGSLHMTGEAVRVARIEVDDRWIERMLASDRHGRPRGI